jgi:hypothetical protein
MDREAEGDVLAIGNSQAGPASLFLKWGVIALWAAIAQRMLGKYLG